MPTVQELQLLLDFQRQQTQQLEEMALQASQENDKRQELRKKEMHRAVLRGALVSLYAKMSCTYGASLPIRYFDVLQSVEYVFHTTDVTNLRKLLLYVHPDRGCSTEESQLWIPALKLAIVSVKDPCFENVKPLAMTLYALLDKPFPGFDPSKQTQSIEAWLASLPEQSSCRSSNISNISKTETNTPETMTERKPSTGMGMGGAGDLFRIAPFPKFYFTTLLQDAAAATLAKETSNPSTASASGVNSVGNDNNANQHKTVRLKLAPFNSSNSSKSLQNTRSAKTTLQTPICKEAYGVDRLRRPMQFLSKQIQTKANWSSREWANMKMPMACFFCCENGIKCSDVLSTWKAQEAHWKFTRKDLVLAGYYQFACAQCMRDPKNHRGFLDFPFFEHISKRPWNNLQWNPYVFANVDKNTGAALARVSRAHRKELGTEHVLKHCRESLGLNVKDYKDSK